MVLSSQHFNTANTEGAQQIMILLLTGKGFVGFIPNDQKQFIENLKKSYYNKLGLTDTEVNTALFVTKPGAGASIWNI